MRVVVSEQASRLIEEQGGSIYVWLKHGRCCGRFATLETATAPPAGKEFRLVDDVAPFRLHVPRYLSSLPQELHLDVRPRSRRVAAYWNGCAWVA